MRGAGDKIGVWHRATYSFYLDYDGSGKTGFEMEALTAIAISGLTIYDMRRAVDSTLRLENIRLTKKSGGKSGTVALE